MNFLYKKSKKKFDLENLTHENENNEITEKKALRRTKICDTGAFRFDLFGNAEHGSDGRTK